MWKPSGEGYDHINISMKSALPIGRALSLSFQSTFIHPEHGMFKSFEGYYYWIRTGQRLNKFKNLSGFHSYNEGKGLPLTKMTPKIKTDLIEGLTFKIIQNEYIQKLMVQSTLPFVYYEYHWDLSLKLTVNDKTKKYNFIIDTLERIRLNLKKHGTISSNNNKLDL